MTAQQFIDVFKDRVEAAGNEDKEKLSKQDFGGNNGYDIVLIDSFEKASKYSAYTTWCVTESEESFENYTNGGVFYFCLKGGFENDERVAGPNTPLDEYGLSMIAVSICPDGQCNTITCRWNHDNGGNDKVMTTEELSKVIGENFYDVFKPKKRRLTLGGKDYVVGVTESGYKALYDEQGNNVLDDGVEEYEKQDDLTKLFGCDVLRVVKSCYFNYVTFQGENVQELFEEDVEGFRFDKYLSEHLGRQWFWVEKDGLSNYVTFYNGNIEFLFDEWFDKCCFYSSLSKQFGCTCFWVNNNRKENHITFKDTGAEYLFDVWFDVCRYDDGLSQQLSVPCFWVEKEGKCNYLILRNGTTTCLFDKWFDGCGFYGELSYRLAVPCFEVQKNEKRNIVIYRDGNNQYLFDEWFDRCIYDDDISYTMKSLCFCVGNSGKFNIASIKDGKTEYLFNEWVGFNDLKRALNNYLRQKNESKIQRLSGIITEMVFKRINQ